MAEKKSVIIGPVVGHGVQVLNTDYKYSQAELEQYGEKGYTGTWQVEDTSNLRVEDAVILRITNTDKSGDAFIVATVERIDSEVYVTCTTVGLVDKGERGEQGAPGATGATGPQGPKGDPGADGTAPTIGANGNWYIGETDTGVSAQGPQGEPGDGKVTAEAIEQALGYVPRKAVYTSFMLMGVGGESMRVEGAKTQEEIETLLGAGYAVYAIVYGITVGGAGLYGTLTASTLIEVKAPIFNGVVSQIALSSTLENEADFSVCIAGQGNKWLATVSPIAREGGTFAVHGTLKEDYTITFKETATEFWNAIAAGKNIQLVMRWDEADDEDAYYSYFSPSWIERDEGYWLGTFPVDETLESKSLLYVFVTPETIEGDLEYGEICDITIGDSTQSIIGDGTAVDLTSAINGLIDTKQKTWAAPVSLYGAKGDGTTDDTEAFQKALAAHRVVRVPGGTYKLSGELMIQDNSELQLAQDTVLQFTNTTGNCISMKPLASIRGHHATITVPYEFGGNVIYIAGNLATSISDTPPFEKWDPMWKHGRYITDLNIVKPDYRGFYYSVDGKCNGTAVYLYASKDDTFNFMWAINLSGLRIAGAFSYGIHAYTLMSDAGAGWNHDMRIEAVIDGSEIGVCLEHTHLAFLSVIVQPRRAMNAAGVYKAYAKHAVKLVDTRNTDMSGSHFWDWDSEKTLWEEGGEYQHLAFIGDCSGTILNEWYYYGNPNYDIRSLIYTDTPSNLERITIIQEPFTRWFKPVDGVPYFSDGHTTKQLTTQDDMDSYFETDRVNTFTDKLSTAITADGEIFGDGKGFVKYGKRYDISSGALVDATYEGCTGYIPVKNGDTIQTKEINFSSGNNYNCICLYDKNFQFIRCGNRGLLVDNAISYFFAYRQLDDGFEIDILNSDDVAYFTLSFSRTNVGDRPVIAINEDIGFRQEGFLAEGIKVRSTDVEGLEDLIKQIIAST